MQFTLFPVVFILFLGSVHAGWKSRSKENQMVAFSASRKNDVKATHDDQIITFANVQTNIGHHYNSGTGIFTVPFDGLYIFQWTILTSNGEVADTYLVVNGSRKRRNAADSEGNHGYRAGTAAIVLLLKKNDKVWITARKDYFIYGHNFSSFQGWLQQRSL